MSNAIAYAYCVVPASGDAAASIASAPGGLDGAALRVVTAGPLAALVSTLDARTYSSDVVATLAGDPEWVAPRAVAHDAVATWASDRGSVVPLPMWVMFETDAGVAAMLDTRRSVLEAGLADVRDAREFGVRVTADGALVTESAISLDPELGAIERRLRTASPGQAYLLRRKLEEARKTAARNIVTRVASEAHEALSAMSRASVVRPGGSARGEVNLALDAAYLVQNDSYDDFRGALTALVDRYGNLGFGFDFTGPWPPYHFVRGDE